MKTIKLIYTFLFIAFSTALFAQESATDSVKKADEYVVIKNDGTEYIGEILKDDGREILINTRNIGKVYIMKSDLKSIIKLEGNKKVVHGAFRESGPFTTRYIFTNNALPIVKGENYTMANLFGPEVHFAVTNNLNIGLMSSWIASPMVLALKYSFKNEESKVNFSAGTLMGTSGYLNSFKGYGGLHWLSATLGDRLNNITLSGGYAYIQTGIKNLAAKKEGIYYNTEPEPIGYPKVNSGPLFSVAAIFKVGAKASFIFDSMCILYKKEESKEDYKDLGMDVFGNYNYTYTVTNSTVQKTALIIMPGMRFQTTDDKAFQFALAGVSIFGGNNVNFPFPMVSWFKKF